MKSSSSLRSPLCRTSVLVDYNTSITVAAETGNQYLPLLELVLELIEIEGWTMTPLWSAISKICVSLNRFLLLETLLGCCRNEIHSFVLRAQVSLRWSIFDLKSFYRGDNSADQFSLRRDRSLTSSTLWAIECSSKSQTLNGTFLFLNTSSFKKTHFVTFTRYSRMYSTGCIAFW